MYVSNVNLAGTLKGRPLFGRSPLLRESVKRVMTPLMVYVTVNGSLKSRNSTVASHPVISFIIGVKHVRTLDSALF